MFGSRSPYLLTCLFRLPKFTPTAYRHSSSNPARSCLYVPASDSRKLSKIFDSKSDCIVLDCEDGVAINRKIQARSNIAQLLNDARMKNEKFAVRINGPKTDLALEDIKIIFKSEVIPRIIFVPKTNHPDDIKWLFSSISQQLATNTTRTNSNHHHLIKFYFYMESAESLLNLRSIIETAMDLSRKEHSQFKLEGLVFGSDDFCADIGAERTQDAFELIYARQKFVTVCKAFRLRAIDMVFIDYKDLEGLEIQSRQGARMGFTGKQVIHPGQVNVVQGAFMPSEAKIKWATGLVEAFNLHQTVGSGAFTYEGQMIDMPSVLQARNVLAIDERAKMQKTA